MVVVHVPGIDVDGVGAWVKIWDDPAKVIVLIIVGFVLLVVGFIAFSIAGTPGVETRQERFDRIEREIDALEERVSELEAR